MILQDAVLQLVSNFGSLVVHVCWSILPELPCNTHGSPGLVNFLLQNIDLSDF